MTNAITPDNRKLLIVQSFVTHQPALRDTIQESCPSLALHEVQSILSELSTRFCEYRPRRFNERAAFRWMRFWSVRQAKRYHFLAHEFWQYGRQLCETAYRLLWRTYAVDEATEPADLVADLALYYVTHPAEIDELLAPGELVLIRLRKKLRNRIAGVYLKKLRNRYRVTLESGATLEKRVPEATNEPSERRLVGMGETLPERKNNYAA